MAEKHTASSRWTMTGGRLLAPAPFVVAGIVNVTPDSFSDGGFYLERQAAMGRVREVLAAGARMVDIGAESTRPGAKDIGPDEEWLRLEPVLAETLQVREDAMREGHGGDIPFAVAVDTYRASTAARALQCGKTGVDVINDVSGGAFDPEMDEVLASYKPGYVLGHSPQRPDTMQDAPHYADPVGEILAWFTDRMTALVKAGLPEDRIVLDPGIGFGKNLEHTLAIFSAIERFTTLGRPLYLGISRKSFIGEITGLETRDRDAPTQVATAFLASRGVHIHRVHDVAQAVATLKMVHVLMSGR